MRTIEQAKADLRLAIDEGYAAEDRKDRQAIKAADLKARRFFEEIRDLERNAAIRSIGGVESHTEGNSPLLKAMHDQGFSPTAQPRVTVSPLDALSLKSGSFSGTIGLDTLPHVLPAPDLGADPRFLYPRVPTMPVDDDIANVASYRQASRTLASPESMLRQIDDTSTKPQTSTVSEVTSLMLGQVATISSGIPSILFNQTSFSGWVRTDVELAWRYAIDAMLVEAINASGAQGPSGTGTNDYERLLYAAETIRTNGYSPSLIALSPSDALAVDLLMLSGGDSYAFTQARPTVVVSPSVADGSGFVMDPGAALTLYVSPVRFQTFEEASGATNSWTVRYENNAGAQIHRPDAICLLSSS